MTYMCVSINVVSDNLLDIDKPNASKTNRNRRKSDSNLQVNYLIIIVFFLSLGGNTESHLSSAGPLGIGFKKGVASVGFKDHWV
jgi:hypothetical protein